ncbi:MAG: 23S rRNA (guanosine(2251)-2'-O)-methyltransferase RlmB [Gammaproteobacteria bacterium]|nr:23S rRNA (guanosine(2251)-2'-O)-methyltransferase RlmB [Gammaproteobacteria bacterium]
MSSDTTIYGIHSVTRLLSARPDRFERLLISAQRDDAAIRLLLASANDNGIAVERCANAELDRLVSGGNHQGVVARLSPAPLLDESGLLSLLDERPTPLLLILDGVQDPHNLGACLRTAEAAGADAVIIPKDRAVGLTPAVRKVAAGSADFIPLARVTNLARVLGQLTERGIWCYGAAADATTSLYQIDLSGPVCLVLGGEGQGLRRLTRERCDGLFSVPMKGGTESLNVSVTAGVCLFEASRQRL